MYMRLFLLSKGYDMLHISVLITALCVPMEKKELTDSTHRMGLPVNFIGGSGVGKSEYVEAAGEALKFFTHTVIPATSNPEDIGGYPIQDGKGGLTRMCDDENIIKLSEVGEGILFLDEVNTNRAQMQAAYLRVVLKRIYGGIQLPPRVRIISAMNPPELSAGGIPLTAPMANRFCHIPFTPPSTQGWSDWLSDTPREDKITMYDAEKEVVKNWGRAWSISSNQVAGFLRASSGMLNDQPQAGDPRGSGPWPSCRTNFWAARALATTRALKKYLDSPPETEDILLQGLTGEAWVTQFKEYLQKADLPDPEDLLRDGWEVDKRRLDRTMTILDTLGSYVATLPANDVKFEKAVRAWEILNKATASGLGDLTYRAATTMIRAGLGAGSQRQELARACQPTLEKLYPNDSLNKRIAGG